MIAILAGLALVAGAALEPRPCRIEVSVSKMDPAAPRSEQRERFIAEPRVVTHFGRPAFFRCGGVRHEPSGVLGPGVGVLVSGFQLEVLPLRLPSGRIRLEVRVVPAGSGAAPRTVTDLKPGTKYRFRGPEGTWIEVSAAEPAAEN